MLNSGKQIIKILFCFAFFSFFISSCADEPAPQIVIPKRSKPKIRVKTPTPQKKAAVEKIRKKMEYVYNPSGKRDPFLPFIARAPMEEVEVSVPKTELQEYELSQLTLVAVMSMGGKKVAMVEDPKGKGHVLRKGTLIGMNKGRVVGIEKDKVLIEERYRDILGDIKSTIKELVIKAPEGGE